MSRLFTRGIFCTGLLLLLCLTNQTTALADAVTIDVVITENGTDVVAKFKIQDTTPNATLGLPKTFRLSLLESGVVIKSVVFTLTDANSTANGGYITNDMLQTFQNASSAVTGRGTNYTLKLDPVPEPTTVLLLGTGLTGVAIKTRKRLKDRKSG